MGGKNRFAKKKKEKNKRIRIYSFDKSVRRMSIITKGTELARNLFDNLEEKILINPFV